MSYGADHNIPDKLYFRIGEVSDLVGVKPYVLRYWETEFTDIKPTKSKSGQRLYRRKDVELLMKIKELLYIERFTINGAKHRLKELGRISDVSVQTSHEGCQTLLESEPLENNDIQDDELVEEVREIPKVESVRAVNETNTSAVDKKFLEKMKNDLLWCLTEIKSV